MLEASLRDSMAIEASMNATTIDTDRDPAFVADVREAVSDPATARALVSWQRSEFGACGLRTCYLDRLGELSRPTLLIHGRDDPVFPVTCAVRAHDRIEQSTFHAVDRCGHWSPREQPAQFNRLVRDFLDGGTTSGA